MTATAQYINAGHLACNSRGQTYGVQLKTPKKTINVRNPLQDGLGFKH